MKNLFALNSLNKLIHISHVDKSIKDIYYCINCGNELIARKGNIKSHHFAHKTILECNFESYLHKLGKLVFFQTYKHCIEKGTPFFIEYETQNICSTCKENELINTTCKFERQIAQFDLTTKFDIVTIEKRFDGFVGDVLLESSSPKISDKIFIEIAVTHQCEIEKLESGNRIIEITLDNEEDIEILKKNIFSLENESIRYYNFKKKNNDKKKFLNKCDKKFDLFSVLKNGKAIKRSVKAKNIVSIFNSKNYIHNKIIPITPSKNEFEDLGGKLFMDLVVEASHVGIHVKNCFACRFFTFNNNYWEDSPYFCKKLKGGFNNTNIGSDCDKFWRIEKPTYDNG